MAKVMMQVDIQYLQLKPATKVMMQVDIQYLQLKPASNLAAALEKLQAIHFVVIKQKCN